MTRICSVVCALLFITGCYSYLVDSGDLSPIQTDRVRYEATPLRSGKLEGVEVSIPMTFTNVTAGTVYFVGCHRPPAPVLQKRVEGEWVNVWGAVELLCLSPPWPITPGEKFRDTLHVQGFWPGQNIAPEFTSDVPGTYRLLRAVHSGPDPLAPLIPEESRVSNEFELVWKAD